MTDSKSQTKQTVLLIKMYDDIYTYMHTHAHTHAHIKTYIICIFFHVLEGLQRFLHHQLELYQSLFVYDHCRSFSK